MKKRLLSGILMVAMAAMTFSACNNNSNSGGGTDAVLEEEVADVIEAIEDMADATGEYSIGVIQLIQHPALDAATEGFSDALKDQLGSGVYIDVQNAAGDSTTCATIANNFVSQGVDLIMANATASLQAAAAATTDIPIVGTSITDYATALDMSDWNGKTGINITGASDLAPLSEQADMVHELFPDAATVGILYCSAEPNSKYQADMIRPDLEAYGYTVKDFTFADSNDVAQVTTAACAECDVIYLPTDNTAANCTENINNVALPAGVPIVAGEEGICSGCGVATLSISYYDMGYNAGLMAAEILFAGTDPGTMEITLSKDLTKEYMASRCQELGVEVPDDYEPIEE